MSPDTVVSWLGILTGLWLIADCWLWHKANR